VVDGKWKKEMSLPSGRAALLERIDAIMAGEMRAQKPSTDPFDRLRDDILAQWSNQLELMELHGTNRQQTLLVVADQPDEALQIALDRQLEDRFPGNMPQLKLLDRDTYATIQELIESGILNANRDTPRTVYRAPAGERPKDDELSRRLTEARNRLARSEHKRRMARVLAEGGFATEALAPMREAVETALQALTLWRDQDVGTTPTLGLIDSKLVKPNLLPAETLSLVARLRENETETDNAQANLLLTQSDRLLSQAASVLASAKAN
jgi:hypothetical protein